MLRKSVYAQTKIVMRDIHNDSGGIIVAPHMHEDLQVNGMATRLNRVVRLISAKMHHDRSCKKGLGGKRKSVYLLA